MHNKLDCACKQILTRRDRILHQPFSVFRNQNFTAHVMKTSCKTEQLINILGTNEK